MCLILYHEKYHFLHELLSNIVWLMKGIENCFEQGFEWTETKYDIEACLDRKNCWLLDNSFVL